MNAPWDYLIRPPTRKDRVPWKTSEMCKKRREEISEEGSHHFHIQCTAPTQLSALMRKRHLNSSSTSHNTFYHLQQCPNGKSISITTHRRTSEGLKCIRKDYIREGAPSKKGIEMIKLEQEGREYQLVSRFEQIIYEHCILKQARERFYTCFVFLFIVLRVGVSQTLPALTTPSQHQCQPIKSRLAFGG